MSEMLVHVLIQRALTFEILKSYRGFCIFFPDKGRVLLKAGPRPSGPRPAARHGLAARGPGGPVLIFHSVFCAVVNPSACTDLHPVSACNTSMSTECSILNFSALGLPAQFISFSTDFTLHKLSSLLYTSQVYFFKYGLKSFFFFVTK